MDQARPIPVLLDTDLGDDIDDALALAVCLNHPGLDLRAVTTVWGDTGLRAAQARYLLALAGRPGIPVAAGARDPLDGQAPLTVNCQAGVLPPAEIDHWRKGRTDGVRLLAELAVAEPGALLVAIGPLTNVARLAREFPAEFSALAGVVIMGGHLLPERSSPEYNFRCDPRAARITLESASPVTLIGLDVTRQCRMSREDLSQIAERGSPLAAALTEMIRLWQRHRGADPEPLPVLHDPLAALVAAGTGLVATEPRALTVDDEGYCVPREGPAHVEFAVQVDAPRAVAWTTELLG